MYSVSSPPAVLRHAGSWSTWRSRLRARKPETPVSTGQCDVVVARVAGCGGGADATKLRLRRARVSALRGSSRGDRAHRRPEGDSAHPQPSQSTHRRSVTVGATAALAIGQSDPCTTRTCRCADASRRAPMSDSAHRGAIRRCVRGISSQHDCLTGVLRRPMIRSVRKGIRAMLAGGQGCITRFPSASAPKNPLIVPIVTGKSISRARSSGWRLTTVSRTSSSTAGRPTRAVTGRSSGACSNAQRGFRS